MVLSHAASMRRHVSMSNANVHHTTALPARISRQSGTMWSGTPRTARHCETSALPMNETTIAAMTNCAASQRLLRRPGDRDSVNVGVVSSNRLGGKGGESVEASRGAERGTAIIAVEQ